MNKRLKTKGFEPKVFPPAEGWIEHGVYLVEVSFNSNNPIHQALFYTGFLFQGKPSNYNQLWNPTWDETTSIERIFYIKAVKYLGKLFEEKVPSLNKLFKDLPKELPPGEYDCKIKSLVKESDNIYTLTVVLK